MDSADISIARGLPLQFRSYREWPAGARHPLIKESGIPGEGSVVEPM
ncbi:hypothetical protein [Glaciihabitans sp. dw_435]|nr:hypothetical protein [Glaciihabitans sp. dw_435]